MSVAIHLIFNKVHSRSCRYMAIDEDFIGSFALFMMTVYLFTFLLYFLASYVARVDMFRLYSDLPSKNVY